VSGVINSDDYAKYFNVFETYHLAFSIVEFEINVSGIVELSRLAKLSTDGRSKNHDDWYSMGLFVLRWKQFFIKITLQ
jgi:hypothetical protein